MWFFIVNPIDEKFRYKQNMSGVTTESTGRQETSIDKSTIIALKAFFLFCLDWRSGHSHQTYGFI